MAILDTFVAFTAGLIIFPACFAFGVSPDSGPNLFRHPAEYFQSYGDGPAVQVCSLCSWRLRRFSTVLAVFENIISSGMDLTGAGRKRLQGEHHPDNPALASLCVGL